MRNIDIAAQYGLDVETYSVELDDNTAYTLPTSIVSPPRVPIAVAIVDAAYPSGVKLESMAWSVDANYAPTVTAQFTSNTNDISATVVVLYKR